MKCLGITICLVICILASLFVGGCQKRPAEEFPAPTSVDVTSVKICEVLVPSDYKETISFHEEITSGWTYVELGYIDVNGRESIVVYSTDNS